MASNFQYMIKALFTEKQRFNQRWLIIIVFLTLAVALWSFIQQIVLGIPFGNNPAPDGILVLLFLTPFILFGFFFSLTLHTRIDQHGITYRFAPIHRKERFIKWDSVKKISVRKYKPIAEYGGWGFRLGSSGTAFNTRGNMGLQLELNDGKKILIGTQKPDELNRVIIKLEIVKSLN